MDYQWYTPTVAFVDAPYVLAQFSHMAQLYVSLVLIICHFCIFNDPIFIIVTTSSSVKEIFQELCIVTYQKAMTLYYIF